MYACHNGLGTLTSWPVRFLHVQALASKPEVSLGQVRAKLKRLDPYPTSCFLVPSQVCIVHSPPC